MKSKPFLKIKNQLVKFIVIEVKDKKGVARIYHLSPVTYRFMLMFTLREIEAANSKVKSGADFPKLAQDLFAMGVKSNDIYVDDGHAEYFGEDGYCVKTGANYLPLEVADQSDTEKFGHYLKIHQQGQTDYPAFSRHSAETGVEKWTLDFDKMTCTYYDKKGNVMLAEKIPSAKDILGNLK